VHVRSIVFCLALLVSSAGCENSPNPFIGTDGGGGLLTSTQAYGNWSITVQRTTNLPCTGGLTNGQVIIAHLDVLTDGTLATTSSWQNPVSGAVLSLSGTVSLTNGAIDLTFGATVGSAMELFPGTMTAGGAITGATLTDPAAGFSQVFGTDGCQYTATATKTG
jgi:hypothetical protein